MPGREHIMARGFLTYNDSGTSLRAVSLDGDEISDGYWAGRDGDPEPGHNRGRSYWHGWRNGAVDGGHREKDRSQAMLAHDFLKGRPSTFRSAP